MTNYKKIASRVRCVKGFHELDSLHEQVVCEVCRESQACLNYYAFHVQIHGFVPNNNSDVLGSSCVAIICRTRPSLKIGGIVYIYYYHHCGHGTVLFVSLFVFRPSDLRWERSKF